MSSQRPPLPDPATIPGDDLIELAAHFGGWWSECPRYSRADWRELVASEDTSLGYWQWVAEGFNDSDTDF